MAVIHLVRHAPTPETGKKLTGRLPGVGLDNAGRDIAQGAADALASTKLAAVYTSPIQRCQETAVIIAAPHGLAPRVIIDFQEVDFGKWEGRTLNSLRKLKAWESVAHTPSRVRFPGGEAMLGAQHRAVKAVEELAGDHPNDRVVVCSHADIIKAIISHYLGQPFDLFQRIVISPASISTVHLPRHGMPIVLAVNGRSA